MQRSPLKQVQQFGSYDEYLQYQQSLGRFDSPMGADQVNLPNYSSEFSEMPPEIDITKLSPNDFQYYQRYGELPVGPDSPYYGRPGEGGGAMPVSTMTIPSVNPADPILTPQSEGGGMQIETIKRLPVQQMPVEKKAFELNVGDVNVNTDSGQVDYKRDFSKSAFSNMSPAMVQGLIGGVSGIAQGLIGRAKRRREQRAAAAEYRARRAEFESLDTSNLAADIQNPFAENVFEDLTVNQQAARFANQQAAASRQNIMESLSGAAGGSGIAGLAQALANQATTAAQQASASIAQQEQRNEMLAAKGELQVQKGEAMTQQMQLAGAERARMLERRQTETLFGMAQQRRAAADQAIAQANAALIGGIGSIAGTVLTGGVSNLAQGLTFFGGGEMVKK
jgi:hypothetical protein